jgi:site-specific recombinase XerD
MNNHEIFKREMVLRRYSLASINTYSSCLSVIFNKIGEKPSIEEIKSFLITIKNRSYHKQMVATIHRYFEFVLKVKLSLKDIPYPRREEKLPEIFSVDEIRKIFAQITNLKHKSIFSLGYGCGLRVSEILNLKFTDIDRSRKIINIRSAKGNKDRVVILDDSILRLLEDYYREFKPKIYVFNGHFKDQYTESSINQFLKKYCAKAGIKKKIYIHLLRHCFATHLYESGTEMVLIQRLLGHSNIKTTQVYAKISIQTINKVQSPFNNIRI